MSERLIKASGSLSALVIFAMITSVGLVTVTTDGTVHAAPCDEPIVDAIACENSKQGNPPSEWDINGSGSGSIQGFATDISVDQGETVRFKVDTSASSYRLDIYRMGYYGGDGARFIDSITPAQVSSQPNCLDDPTTGLVDCGNWSESAAWGVPADAVSGIYFAKLVRTDGSSGASHVMFVVRDDDGGSDILFQTADTTWQAYNEYGGNSLYTGSPAGRAYKVSYNRPFTTRDYAPEDWVFNAEYPMVRYLEANGYDVSYTTGVDSDRLGSELLEHSVFLSVGHDEYWSGDQRANVEAARDAGVSLAFASGNEVYWKTRWENSIDGSSSPYRTLVSYKETAAGAIIDPEHPTWTGTWRDTRFSPPADGGQPENELTGTIFRVNCCEVDMEVDADDGDMRFWRDTRVEALTGNQTTTIGDQVIGYEWDEDLDNGFRPAGLFRVSETFAPNQEILLDEGTSFGPGDATHAMTMYRAPSGALVFGAGSVQWSWALDDAHDRGPSATADVAAQQAMVNLLADMGVQPATLQAGLVAAAASTDATAPTSTITAPTDGESLPPGSFVTVTGTAIDAGGGNVGGVEVSTDGGATWRRAEGRSNWTYQFTTPGSGTLNILSRATDDSANLESPSAGVTVTAGGPVNCPCSLWPTTAQPDRTETSDTNSVEVGVVFEPSEAGFITGIRFHKATSNTGTHIGNLWTESGSNLGSVTFTGESGSGWQEANFASPIPVAANTRYIASYFAPNGQYSASSNYFASQWTNGPLSAPATGPAGGNGRYQYTNSAGTFPSNSFNAENYWVDVVFDTSVVDTSPPSITDRNPDENGAGVSIASNVSATFNEPVTGATISLSETSGPAVPATTSYDAGTRTITLTPAAPLDESTGYSVTVDGAIDGAGNVMTASNWTFTTSGPSGCPCSIWDSSATPDRTETGDTNSVEVGVVFDVAESGYVTGIRFHKAASNTGTHTGSLWTSTGALLGNVTFTNESGSGWQQADFSQPIPVDAGARYVASYFAPNGQYSASSNYFSAGITNGPLTAPSSGTAGGNGRYQYTGSAGTFPGNSFNAENYWVDVVFDVTATDTTAPTIATRTPAAGATGVAAGTSVSATFNEPVTGAGVSLDVSGGAAVAGSTSYDAGTRTITFTPDEPLAFDTTYTVGVDGAVDTAGNPMAPANWNFTTGGPPPPLPTEGPGGPIGVVTSGADAFSGYFAEILRSEGLNEFETFDVANLDAAKAATFSTIILGPVPVSAGQVSMLTSWVDSGGNLIASRPDQQLAPLFGLSPGAGVLSDAYLGVDTAVEPGVGIVSDTMQFHGTADLYTLSGATAVATLYSDPTTATGNPAVSLRSVGSNGGQVAAFTYDLARSVVYTRQGNPAWEGQERDGGLADGIIRTSDLYFGGSQPDWVDLDKVAIPQADEQQRLLANIIQLVNRDAFPLPRFWYFPDDHKAVVVATGDDHNNGGTTGRFDAYLAASPSGCSVADWECPRITSYVYPGTLSNAAAAAYEAQGFEIAPHVSNGCRNFTSTDDLRSTYTSEVGSFSTAYSSVSSPVSNRFHCLVWSDWSSQFVVEGENGIRFDVNYYYWPSDWLNNRPGFMTGSGMPQRFSNTDGTLVDVYQGATQMTDESGQTYPFTVNTLLDRALGVEGYYGYFVTNHHTDLATKQEDSETLAAAQSRGVPVVTARAALEFIDGRNASSFDNVSWSGTDLGFGISVGAGANNLTAMLPIEGPNASTLNALQRNGSPVSFELITVKGVEYATFSAVAGDHIASYGAPPADTTAPTVTAVSPPNSAVGVSVTDPVSVTFDEPVVDTSVQISVTPSGGAVVAGATSYDAGSNTATFTPDAALANTTTYTVDVSGATDLVGNTMAPAATTFTTVADAGCPCNIFGSAVPPVESSPDGAIEVGVKFQATQDGWINGIRFYKGAGNTGTHVGNLWTSTGTLLGSVTFTGETATGWQEATFASPVPVSASTTYVASYHAPNGGYAIGSGEFANAVTNGPLTALASAPSGGNGVYLYGGGGFPASSFNSSNYYVDVSFASSPPPADMTPPSVSAVVPADGAADVAVTDPVTVTFDEPVVDTSVQISVTPSGGSAVAGAISYDATSNTATFTPAGPLANTTAYTLDVSGATDPAGNVMAAAATTFTTGAAPPADTTPPTVSVVVPADGATAVAVSDSVSVTFDEPVVDTSVQISVTPSGGAVVAGATSYDAGSNTATFTPDAALANTTTYAVDVSGATDLVGNTMAPAATTFTTVADAGCPCNIFGSAVPPVESSPDAAVELGVKFQASQDGVIDGIRFYKGAGNTGTHVGNLWTSTGTLLGSVTFANETATGWQEATFASPVPVTAGTTYVASYHAPNGGYAIASGGFATAVTNGPLTALASAPSGGNGLYGYGSGGFPTSTFNSSNYFVDVIFGSGGPPPDVTAPTVTAVVPADGAIDLVASSSVAVTFSEPVVDTSVVIAVTPNGGAAVAGSMSYDAGTNTATFTPTSPLANAVVHTVDVSGATDAAGNTMAPVATTFTTTAVADTTVPTVTAVVPADGAIDVVASSSVAVTFSEPVVDTSVVIAVTPNGGAAVAGSMSYDAGTNTATFTPTSPLANAVVHTVDVSGATDAAGNTMAPVATTFTTAASPPATETLYLSTVGNTAVPGVGSPDDADIYSWDGAAFARVFDAAGSGGAGLPSGADVDGYDRVDATSFYVSFTGNVSVPGLGTVQDEDVVFFDGASWSLYFDGTALGLTANGHDVDAIDVAGGVLYFSTVGNSAVPGLAGQDDADIYSWDGVAFARLWDASAAGLPGSADIDGLRVVDTTTFYASFKSTNTTIPGLGALADVSIGLQSAGVWSLYFDGVSSGLAAGTGHDVDAFDIS